MDKQSNPKPSEGLESEVVTRVDPAELAPEVEAMHLANLEGIPDHDADLEEPLNSSADLSDLTGGDRDIDPYLAEVVGEEAVGGSTPTPDQNVVEDLATAVGIETADQEILHTGEILEQRDSHRWELDPQSSEDYDKHED